MENTTTPEQETPRNPYDNEAFRKAVRLEIERIAREALKNEFESFIVRLLKGCANPYSEK